MKIWGKIWKSNHMLQDMVVEDTREDTRTHKILHCLEQICLDFDLGQPIWLDTSIREFQRHSRVRFYQDSFIEDIPFDYLEIQVLEE